MDDFRLSQAAREARNQYYRAWNAANKDKRAAINRRYWERRAAKLSLRNKENGLKRRESDE